MKLLLQTNNPTLPPFVQALLASCDIECFVWDTHMSVLEGSINLFPQRIMVLDRDYDKARNVLIDNAIELPDES